MLEDGRVMVSDLHRLQQVKITQPSRHPLAQENNWPQAPAGPGTSDPSMLEKHLQGEQS